MKRLSLVALVLSCLFSSIVMAAPLAINHIQLKGTHNSYHQQSAIAFHPSHKYTHLSLGDQLEKRGIRAFELDVHQPLMGQDLVVYHIGLIDAKTSCSKFKDCLREMRNWSDEHPEHVTVFVWIEVKDDTGGAKFKTFDGIDREIREVLGDRLITPDEVQGSYSSLQEAITNEGWPSLESSRGKFLFMLDNHEKTKVFYLQDNTLHGRVMFPRASESTLNEPWAAVTKTAPGAFHSAALSKNFLISDNVCSAGDTSSSCFSRLNAAISAGTNLLMDDFEGGEKAQMNGDYFVQFSNGLKANCNLSKAYEDCFDSSIDPY